MTTNICKIAEAPRPCTYFVQGFSCYTTLASTQTTDRAPDDPELQDCQDLL